jgi:hypothetical protein
MSLVSLIKCKVSVLLFFKTVVKQHIATVSLYLHKHLGGVRVEKVGSSLGESSSMTPIPISNYDINPKPLSNTKVHLLVPPRILNSSESYA